jgi:hypothetical protein
MRTILWGVVGLGAAFLIVGGIVIVGSIRAAQIDGTPFGKKLAASSDRLVDCTTQGHACYDQQQRRTGRYLGSIATSQQDAAAAGAWCANQPGTRKSYPAMLRCVKRAMAVSSGPTFQPENTQR